MNTIQPTLSHLFHAFGMNLSEGIANWRHRVEARLEERRIRAELDAMSDRERQEIDVTAGNNAWTTRR
jgi:uncharacterized protein YjiS (DUF1127 family)